MANHSFWEVIISSSLACGVTALGIYIISRREDWGRKYSAYFMSFAAGVLVSISLVHIAPESFSLSASAPAFLLAGFLALYLVNRFLSSYLCHDRETVCEIGLIPMIGIGVHSFIDGVIYSVTFQVSFFTGAGAATGMILHEFPEEILTFVLLKRGGFSHKRSIVYAFFSAALSTPLGALVSYPFVMKIKGEPLGSILALAGGALLYVGATHLLPAVEKEKKKYGLLTLAAGVAVAFAVLLLRK